MRALLLYLLLLLLIYPHPIADQPVHTAEASRADTAETFIATAYVATGHATRSGRMPQVGRTVAVDESIIPLGSRVRVDGRDYVAEDTGRLVKGRKIDLFMGDERTAKAWGIRLVEVEVEK